MLKHIHLKVTFKRSWFANQHQGLHKKEKVIASHSEA